MYRYLYLRFARLLLMLQAAAGGTLAKLSTEHVDRSYIITLVMSRCEHAVE